jgi:hypothetical protein
VGGVSIEGNSLVDFVLCVFTDNKANSAVSVGGGGLLVASGLSSSPTVNLLATRFIRNTASAAGGGGDIYASAGTVNVGAGTSRSCPDPYEFEAVAEGELDTEGVGSDPTYSYFCYYPCPPSYYNPTLGSR